MEFSCILNKVKSKKKKKIQATVIECFDTISPLNIVSLYDQ